MASVNLFLVCVLTTVCLVLFAVQISCQLSGDFSSEDYDDLNHELANKPQRDRTYANQAGVFPKRKTNLTVGRIKDYLFSIQSKVLSSNDVLTVKDRKEVDTSPKKNKTYVSALKYSKSKPDPIQADQPSSPVHWQHVSPTSNSSHISESTTTRKPSYNAYGPWNVNEQRLQHDTPNLWNCEFKANHDCGIVNDQSVGDLFHLENKNFFQNFNWNNWYLMLNVSSALEHNRPGARLIIPYMETKNVSQGCLSMQYITMTSGVAKVTLYQQDQGNHCIWSTEPKANPPPGVPVNHQLEFTIDLFRGSPRFFLELYLDLSQANVRETIFALANIRLSYRPCFSDNANHCRPPKPARATSEHEIP